MAIYRTDIGRALDELISNEEGTFLHFAPVVGPAAFPGGMNYLASQQVRVYPDPRYPVILLGSTTDTQFGSYIATISGYFEPLGASNLSP
jgi:hypothetical protein